MPANTPRLETERLVLRRFPPADVEPLFSLRRRSGSRSLCR